MELVGDPEDGDREVIASRVEFADSTLERARGFMFRSVPDDYALVFRFSVVRRRGIHTLAVPDPIDVCWLVGERIERMHPYRGLGFARADTVVEPPAGAADGLSVGDRVVFEGREGTKGVSEPELGTEGPADVSTTGSVKRGPPQVGSTHATRACGG